MSKIPWAHPDMILRFIFQILVQSGTIFVPTCFKISKKNNLKQKSYKDFSFLKICKCVNQYKT